MLTLEELFLLAEELVVEAALMEMEWSKRRVAAEHEATKLARELAKEAK